MKVNPSEDLVEIKLLAFKILKRHDWDINKAAFAITEELNGMCMELEGHAFSTKEWQDVNHDFKILYHSSLN